MAAIRNLTRVQEQDDVNNTGRADGKGLVVSGTTYVHVDLATQAELDNAATLAIALAVAL